MNTIIIILLLAVIFGLYAVWRSLRDKTKTEEDPRSLLLLQNQVQDLMRVVDAKINDVHGELIKLHETNNKVIGFTDQLQSLQDILKNPKQRGVLGEYYLETLLKNVLPPGAYKMQYNLGIDEVTGKELIVDAAVFVKDKIIPIDSKFSLENYNRIIGEKNLVEREKLEKLFKNDLKNRIDETSKYIAPSKGTMDFAFMFIPHEAIYYDLLINEVGAIKVNTRSMIDYAFKEKHVIIVSPTSFLAYLQTVLHGLNALQIEESAKEIIKRVNELGKHLFSYEMYLKKLGNNLGTTVSMYNNAYKEFGKIDKDVSRITDKKTKSDPLTLEPPISDDDESR